MEKRRLLLISNSTSHGSGYLDHCAGNIEDFLGRDERKVAFVPYAKNDMDGYERTAGSRFVRMGYRLKSVHGSNSPGEMIGDCDAVFIGGGNTFLLLKRLYDKGLVDVIRDRVSEGMPYIGTSAGSNVACASIMTTNDMPIVYPPSFTALGLVPFNINPHYVDPDPRSTHMGETRQQRLREFHEVNSTPVVGLREGSMLRVENNNIRLLGSTGAVLIVKGGEPVDYNPGSDLSWILI
ncbi:MAG: dipeptidase PepE [Thermoplasmatota archaeon]